MVDGCTFHELTGGSVESRWKAVAGEESSMCACCLGPCRVGVDFCTRCETITPVQVRYLELRQVEVFA